jgi:hypothetical protein
MNFEDHPAALSAEEEMHVILQVLETVKPLQ